MRIRFTGISRQTNVLLPFSSNESFFTVVFGTPFHRSYGGNPYNYSPYEELLQLIQHSAVARYSDIESGRCSTGSPIDAKKNLPERERKGCSFRFILSLKSLQRTYGSCRTDTTFIRKRKEQQTILGLINQHKTSNRTSLCMLISSIASFSFLRTFRQNLSYVCIGTVSVSNHAVVPDQYMGNETN